MIDETLYRETFSRLQASEKAKKEVLEKMKNTKKMRLPRVLRGGVIAAALIAALAVSAAAAAGGGLLEGVFHELTIIWSDGFHDVMVDEEGNEWNAYNVSAETELRDGRLILKAMGQEADITDELEKDGEAVRTFERDGFDLTVTVTGTVEEPYIFSSSSDTLGVVACENQDGAVSERVAGPEPGDIAAMTDGSEARGGEVYTFRIANKES